MQSHAPSALGRTDRSKGRSCRIFPFWRLAVREGGHSPQHGSSSRLGCSSRVAAAAAPVASRMDEDRRCTVCVALLGQYNKVEALLEGGCDGLCSTEDGTLDYSGFSALVDAVEVRCLGLG